MAHFFLHRLYEFGFCLWVIAGKGEERGKERLLRFALVLSDLLIACFANSQYLLQLFYAEWLEEAIVEACFLELF